MNQQNEWFEQKKLEETSIHYSIKIENYIGLYITTKYIFTNYNLDIQRFANFYNKVCLARVALPKCEHCNIDDEEWSQTMLAKFGERRSSISKKVKQMFSKDRLLNIECFWATSLGSRLSWPIQLTCKTTSSNLTVLLGLLERLYLTRTITVTSSNLLYVTLHRM